MRIIKCEACGKFIHESDRCYHCGTKNSEVKIAEEVVVDDNAAELYETMTKAFEKKEYNKAYDYASKCLEWMPRCPEIFWMRLLAKKRCKNDAMLLLRGVDVDNDTDYRNAMRFASKESGSVYGDIEKEIRKIKKVLVRELCEMQKDCPETRKILHYKEIMPVEAENLRNELKEEWHELLKIELQMRLLELDCEMLAYKNKQDLSGLRMEMSSYLLELDADGICSHKKCDIMEKKINQCKEEIYRANSELIDLRKKHAWICKMKEFQEKQAEQMESINSVKKKITEMNAKMEKMLDDYKKASSKYNDMRQRVRQGDFSMFEDEVLIQIYRENGTIL